ncbi:hypothetical protein [Clostridium vitabionis]|nr:hypothetical protein [Clostridium vitabionis]
MSRKRGAAPWYRRQTETGRGAMTPEAARSWARFYGTVLPGGGKEEP